MVYSGGWMEVPSGLPNCPRGLEYLTMLDQLLVKQKVNLAQVLVGFEQNNKFVVKNSLGQDVIQTRFLHSPSLLKHNFHSNFALPLTTLTFIFEGFYGRRRHWLLYTELLRSNAPIRYESTGRLSKWNYSFLSAIGLFKLLLSMLFAIIGSVITTWKCNLIHVITKNAIILN